MGEDRGMECTALLRDTRAGKANSRHKAQHRLSIGSYTSTTRPAWSGKILARLRVPTRESEARILWHRESKQD
jgi:hypothetical protein